jgi:DNA-binding transcriptional ArsR family regulator
MVLRDAAAADDLDRKFHALADPTRRDILVRTLEREHSVSELAERYPMSFAAVQKHVAVLEKASLVTKRAHHRHRFVRADHAGIDMVNRALDDLEEVWRRRLDRFEQVLSDEAEDATASASDDHGVTA